MAATDYPRVVEYGEALQHPARCFRDPQLRAAVAETDARGLPNHATGGNAAVFKLRLPGGRCEALKVFKYHNPLRAERYRAVSDHLRGVRCRGLVAFDYSPEGVRAPRGAETYRDALWYPTLRMEWVDGLPLKQWIDGCVSRGDRAALRRMADRWAELLDELGRLRIAHGDLQHGNVLVRGGELVLVDYDGMCVPALEGQEAVEHGLPGYQHPGRVGQPLSAGMDAFSAWVVWLGLRAAAARPALWQKHVTAAANDNIFFTAADLHAPERSALWPDLLALDDAEAARAARALRDALAGPFERVPPFGAGPPAARDALLAALADGRSDLRIADAFESLAAAGLALPDGAPAARCAEAVRRRDGLLGLRRLPAGLPADRRDEEWVRRWHEAGLDGCPDVTAAERQAFREAVARRARSGELLAALAAGDLDALGRLAGDPLLAGYPPVEAVRDQARRLLDDEGKVRHLLRRLRGEPGDSGEPDLSCVAAHPGLFRPHADALRQLLQEVMDGALLRAQGGPEVLQDGQGTTPMILLRWTGWRWPTLGLGERACRVAVSAQTFHQTPAGAHCSQVRQGAYSADRGVRRAVPAGAREVFVTVWPVLRLEALGVEAHGPPLHLAAAVPRGAPPAGALRKLLRRVLSW
jgi:hypothetical protein